MSALCRWFRQTVMCDHMVKRVAHHRDGRSTLVRVECAVCSKALSPGVIFEKAV